MSSRDQSSVPASFFGGTLVVVLALVLLPLLVPLVLILVAVQSLYAAFIYTVVWFWFIPRGKDVLFVSSKSPNWHDYMESAILPLVKDRAIVLDYSERAKWRRWALSTLVFRFFGGYRDFNPLVVRFYRFAGAHTIRFRKGFIEAKHGKPAELESLRLEVLSVIAEERDNLGRN